MASLSLPLACSVGWPRVSRALQRDQENPLESACRCAGMETRHTRPCAAGLLPVLPLRPRRSDLGQGSCPKDLAGSLSSEGVASLGCMTTLCRKSTARDLVSLCPGVSRLRPGCANKEGSRGDPAKPTGTVHGTGERSPLSLPPLRPRPLSTELAAPLQPAESQACQPASPGSARGPCHTQAPALLGSQVLLLCCSAMCY